jgi:putative ABC transport system permease protein
VATDLPGWTGRLSDREFAIILAYATVMLGVCLLACVVPTRRALAVAPTIALRMD